MSASHQNIAPAGIGPVSGATNLVDANNVNLDVARSLLKLSVNVPEGEVRNSLLAEIKRMLDNSERISSALRVSKIIPKD